jgi:hypothetical protein
VAGATVIAATAIATGAANRHPTDANRTEAVLGVLIGGYMT